MLVSFTLSMSNTDDPSAKWIPIDGLYCSVVDVPINSLKIFLDKKVLDYDFENGWIAHIAFEEVDETKAASLRSESRGFCGYGWMIYDIIHYGEIKRNAP